MGTKVRFLKIRSKSHLHQISRLNADSWALDQTIESKSLEVRPGKLHLEYSRIPMHFKVWNPLVYTVPISWLFNHWYPFFSFLHIWSNKEKMSIKFLSNICNKPMNKGDGDGKTGMDTKWGWWTRCLEKILSLPQLEMTQWKTAHELWVKWFPGITVKTH